LLSLGFEREQQSQPESLASVQVQGRSDAPACARHTNGQASKTATTKWTVATRSAKGSPYEDLGELPQQGKRFPHILACAERSARACSRLGVAAVVAGDRRRMHYASTFTVTSGAHPMRRVIDNTLFDLGFDVL